MSDYREQPRSPEFTAGHASLPPHESSPDYPPTSAFPPVGHPGDYSPPGYAPLPAGDYPPPGYPPPPGYAPPGYAAPPPPRRSNVPLIALVLAVTLLLCGGVVTTGVLLVQRATDKAKEAAEKLPDALPTTLPTALPSDVSGLTDGKEVTVKYEVTGSGSATILYTEKLGDLPKTIKQTKLPWKLSLTMAGASFASVTAIRESLEDGSISCRVTVDGTTAAEHTASGPAATATCNKLVFN
ncbi:MmpS family transport accessory protein [Actinoplanes oblitus]|uniref:MmpS family transport accessory protein n=1 Tax=Actinoplanes oblitus TaxID=3040509 RepID=A0ABY8WIC8_9ACTN|nr:MmpS family transport accessory protein [Actinoplanes oblitus]WIM97172.1 MmpS family transport accessory protein [Actinoplanes oblitus]